MAKGHEGERDGIKSPAEDWAEKNPMLAGAHAHSPPPSAGIDVNSEAFKKAVAEAAAAAVAQAMATLQANQPSPAAVGSAFGNDKNFIESLTLSLAELSNQGTGRVYTAPEVLKARDEARERMIELIQAAKRNGDKPEYRLTNKIEYFGTLIEPMWIGHDRIARPTEITFYGIPNDAMVPINETAKVIHQAWRDSIGGIKRVVPEDRLGMTAKGLVVRNSAIPSAIGPRAPLALSIDDQNEMLVHGRGQPGDPSRKPILGTIVDPPVTNVTPHVGSPGV